MKLEAKQEFWSNFIHPTWIPLFLPYTEKFIDAIEQLKKDGMYDEAHSDGYQYRNVVVRSTADPKVKSKRFRARCMPRLPDICSPFAMVPKPAVRVVLIAGVPDNTGLATGVPFLYSKDRYNDPYIYSPADGKTFINTIEVNAIEQCLSSSLTGTGSVYEHVRRTNLVYDISPKGYSVLSWMQQGVLPIHSILTTDEIKNTSHVDAWRPIMKEIIHDLAIDLNNKGVIVVLGRIAKDVCTLLTDDSFIYAPEPGACSTPELVNKLIEINPFARANELLIAQGVQPILW